MLSPRLRSATTKRFLSVASPERVARKDCGINLLKTKAYEATSATSCVATQATTP
jgi:hypothetical protein